MKAIMPADMPATALIRNNTQYGKNGRREAFSKFLHNNTSQQEDMVSTQVNYANTLVTEQLHLQNGEQRGQCEQQNSDVKLARSLTKIGDVDFYYDTLTPSNIEQLTDPLKPLGECSSTKSVTLVEPHVQLAFASQVLANRVNLTTSHHANAEIATSKRVPAGFNLMTDHAPNKQASQSTSVSATKEIIPQSQAAAETSNLVTNVGDESDDVALQQLLIEYQQFLRKQILVSKNDERLLVYVRDYEASPSELGERLNALSSELQKKFRLPVCFVVNGAAPTSEQQIFSTGDRHAS